MTDFLEFYSDALQSEALFHYIHVVSTNGMPQSNLVILSGPPYSGKTVFRENFLALMSDVYQSNAWWVLSSDDIRKIYAAENQLAYNETFDERSKKSVAQQFEQKIINLQKNTNGNIIVDMMNLKPRDRERMISRLGSGRKVTVISFDKPNEKILDQRVTSRLATQFVSKKFASDVAENQTIPDMKTEGIDYFLRADNFGHVYLFTDGKQVLTSNKECTKTIICNNED